MIYTGAASDLPGYIAPRPQIIYPDGTIVYLDATNTPTTSTASATSTASTYQFIRDLERDMTGDDVLLLQQYLNAHGFVLAESGLDSTGSPRAGSPGNETDYFGSLTKAALIAFQNAHASDILAPVGLSSGTGYFGASTRAFVNTN